MTKKKKKLLLWSPELAFSHVRMHTLHRHHGFCHFFSPLKTQVRGGSVTASELAKLLNSSIRYSWDCKLIRQLAPSTDLLKMFRTPIQNGWCENNVKCLRLFTTKQQRKTMCVGGYCFKKKKKPKQLNMWETREKDELHSRMRYSKTVG